ncbi:hypothetical protein DL93DRAFT_2166887 [Clavulina sp. PMI_390]|nr:hypothetical protein DL93DRAFT_2166887 [Clavulina sp. PMI_390]
MQLIDTLISYLPRAIWVAALVFPTTRAQRLRAFAALVVTSMWTAFRLIISDEPGIKAMNAYSEVAGMAGLIPPALFLLLGTDDPRTSITWLKPTTSSAAVESKDGKTKTVQKQKTYLADDSLTFQSRLRWAFTLTFNPRMIGTNVQAANVIPLSPSLSSSRYNFCMDRLFILAKSALIMGPMAMIPKYFPSVLDAATKTSPTIVERMLVTSGGLIFNWNLLNSGQCLLAFLAVALRVSEPDEWPDLFGALGDAYTLRRAWGRAWHQILRKPFELSGNAVASFFGATPHTFASKYLKLYTAFAFSAFVHMWGDFSLYSNTLSRFVRSNNPWAIFSMKAMFTPQFFLSQVVGIMVEDHVIDAIKWAWRSGKFGKGEDEKEAYPPNVVRLGKMLGYVWVFVWFCATFYAYQQPLMFWTFAKPQRMF